jgi:hypothetical protein
MRQQRNKRSIHTHPKTKRTSRNGRRRGAMGAYTRPSRMKKRKLGSCKQAHDNPISMRYTSEMGGKTGLLFSENTFEMGAKTGLLFSKGTIVPRSVLKGSQPWIRHVHLIVNRLHFSCIMEEGRILWKRVSKVLSIRG